MCVRDRRDLNWQHRLLLQAPKNILRVDQLAPVGLADGFEENAFFFRRQREGGFLRNENRHHRTLFKGLTLNHDTPVDHFSFADTHIGILLPATPRANGFFQRWFWPTTGLSSKLVPVIYAITVLDVKLVKWSE
jgi:hypothetical protein